MIERNQYDKDGQSLESGLRAESEFQILAESKGWRVAKSNRDQDIFEHWDFLITKGEKCRRVEVKSAKKINRRDVSVQSEWFWVEFRGVRDEGWLNGKADVIALERETEFWIVRRTDLKKRAERLVDKLQTASSSAEAKYKLYQRKNRRDLISLIEFSKIEDLDKAVWEKVK